MAMIIKMDQSADISKLHSITYETAKLEVPADKYNLLVDASEYRNKFATDASRFEKVLPIFIVKPLYVFSCSLLHKSGISLTKSTVLPSIIAYFFIGLFLLYWSRRYLKTWLAFAISLFIMYTGLMLNMARLSTPDCLSGLFLFMSCYFILEKRNIPLMVVLFLLAILTRLDNVIFCFAAIAFLTFIPHQKLLTRKQFVLLTLLFGLIYIGVVSLTFQFGWDLSYYSQYSRHIDFSSDFDQPSSLSRHFALMYSKLITMLYSFHFMLFMALSILLLGTAYATSRRLNFDHSFLLLFIGLIAFRFLLLPDLSDRFYFWIYLVVFILLMKEVVKTGKPGEK